MSNPSDSPSQGRQHVAQTLSAPQAGQVTVVFLGPLRGMGTHFQRGRSYHCPGAVDCPAAMHKLELVWKGYAPVRYHVVAGDWWLPAALEITECLEELLRGRHLAGELWQLYRDSGRRKTRQVTGHYLETRPIDGVFEWFDIEPILRRRYHTERLVLDVPNRVVPRVILAAVQAPAAGATRIAAPSAERPATTEELERLRQLRKELGLRLAAQPDPISLNGHRTK